MSIQPTSRTYVPGGNNWQYTGESITITVPPGPSHNYLLSLRQTLQPCWPNFLWSFTFGTDKVTPPGQPLFFSPYDSISNTNGTMPQATVAEKVIALTPGTYTYYVWAYGSQTSGGCPSILWNAQSDGRLYSDVFAVPLD